MHVCHYDKIRIAVVFGTLKMRIAVVFGTVHLLGYFRKMVAVLTS
jgi:hypothetical protein